MTSHHTPSPNLLSGRTLFRSGLALLVLAAVFFLRYSIEQGWLGPVARVALAGGVGLAMIGLGVWVEGRRPSYGVLAQGAGAAVLFLTAYAAHDHYGLTSTTEAFLQLVVVAVLTLVLAFRSESELLASIGLTAAAAAPTLIEGRMAAAGAEIGYIGLIGAVSTVLFFRYGWWRTHVAAAAALIVSVTADLIPAGLDDRTLAVALESALVVTWLMLVAAPLAGTVIGTGPHAARITVPIVTSSVGTLILYGGTRLIFSDVESRLGWSAFAVGLAGAHLLMSRVVARNLEARAVASAQLVPATTLAIVAMVEGLTGDWVLVGSALLALALVYAGHNGGHRRLADAGHLLFLLTGVLTVGAAAIVTGDVRTLPQLLPGMAVLTTAAVIGLVVGGTSDDDLSSLYFGGAYFGALLWAAVEMPRLGPDGLAWVTAAWTTVGIGAIVAGRLAPSRLMLGSGFATVGLAVGKLFLVDLAEASPLARIGLFAGVGILLVAGGYWLGDWSLDSNDLGADRGGHDESPSN
jgi:hypothetical protein